MGFIVGPQEIKVRVRYYRGSVLWTFGFREAFWIASILFAILSPRLFLAHADPRSFDFENFIYVIAGVCVLQMAVLLWTVFPKWVATLRSSGIEYRSYWSAGFGWGGWKKASWAQVERVQSTKTYERDGVVSTRGIQMDILDPGSPSGLYSLRISAAEAGFMDYLEAMVRWIDPAKADPDLRRILEGGNRKRLDGARQWGRNWGVVLGVFFGLALFGIRGYPPSERWMIYGGIMVVALAAGFVLRHLRKG